MTWSPRSGAQLEFGRQLRQMSERSDPPRSAAGENSDEDPAQLRFKTQATVLTEDNLRWTARARYGTYKFFGFVATQAPGYAYLTPAGERFVTSSRPGEVLLRQLLKWQYPDNQHHGSRWPAEDFAIFPFVATARLIQELGGLSRQEISLFCFTMRRTEDVALTAEAIRQFRQRQTRHRGRVGKATTVRRALEAAQARYHAEGRRVVVSSTDDYADALIRYFRYTGLFSVRGARIVVANGREAELDELVYAGDLLPRTIPARRSELPFVAGRAVLGKDAADRFGTGPIQLALGEAPPVRLAMPRPLFPEYTDSVAFYTYYGDAEQPRLPWEDPTRLAAIARTLDVQVGELRAREALRRTGRSVLTGPQLGSSLPESYASLVEIVDRLRRQKLRWETALYAAESRTPQRLKEALDFYGAILSREVIDPPTFLEWNTWRVFLALDHAREIVPHLALDDDLQPLNTAQGNQPDLEVDFGSFMLVVEVTLRVGADQRQAEARPVTRHILDVQRRYNRSASAVERPVVGLFLAPKIHADTVTDFFVALKYRVIERQQIAAIPLTLRQFTAALRPFTGRVEFEPKLLTQVLNGCVQAGLEAATGEEWLTAIDATLRRWLASIGVPAGALDVAIPAPLPLLLGS